ncbi:MAG: DUF2809 domain-containing protein [Agriterribacter sp.]
MKNTLQFNLVYFILFILLFITEVLIALYSRNSIIRSYIGDVLVVILIYCLVKSFFDTPVFVTAIAVLLFSSLVEMLQYFKIVYKLGLEHAALARVFIGTSFSWWDIVSYTIGIATVLGFEKISAAK